MLADQIIRIQQRSLDALAAHYVETFMDDAKYIQIIRVLISAAVSLLSEDGESDTTMGQVESSLREHAREFYISNCAQNNSEISNIADFMNDCGEMFDYIYISGTYPDD